jgi:Fic family protein
MSRLENRSESRNDRSGQRGEKRQQDNDSCRRPIWARSLENGLTVLSHFENESTVLGAADIERLTGLSRQTAHKCLVTLAALGYVVQTASRKYQLVDIEQRIAVRRGEQAIDANVIGSNEDDE